MQKLRRYLKAKNMKASQHIALMQPLKLLAEFYFCVFYRNLKSN